MSYITLYMAGSIDTVTVQCWPTVRSCCVVCVMFVVLCGLFVVLLAVCVVCCVCRLCFGRHSYGESYLCSCTKCHFLDVPRAQRELPHRVVHLSKDEGTMVFQHRGYGSWCAFRRSCNCSSFLEVLVNVVWFSVSRKTVSFWMELLF